jgi:hypothetical protein
MYRAHKDSPSRPHSSSADGLLGQRKRSFSGLARRRYSFKSCTQNRASAELSAGKRLLMAFSLFKRRLAEK